MLNWYYTFVKKKTKKKQQNLTIKKKQKLNEMVFFRVTIT